MIENNENNELINVNEGSLSMFENADVDIENVASEDISEKFRNIENDILETVKKQKKPKKKREGHTLEKVLLIIFAVVMLVAVVGFSIYCIVSDISKSDLNSIKLTKPDFTLSVSDTPRKIQMYADENGKYTLEGLAAVVKPQIVEIYTYTTESEETPSGSGSGIIISRDGYIVTNTHVLDGMKKFMVTTYDGKTYKAQISGRDAKTDIAVIKIEAHGLVPAKFGNSDYVVQGEAVAVIGNPAGLTGSITDGIVSGLNRKIRGDETGYEMNCIQTNAAISPGNSGGALVNMYGEVIGITSSKYAAMTTEGLGFAITINEAKPIIEELVTKGYVSGRVRIGITFYSAYANYMGIMFKDEFGFEIPSELKDSLWISEISKDCDISNTELKAKDFIVEFDGKKVTSYSDLENVIRGKKGGDIVKAKCARVSDKGEVSYFDIEFKLMADTSGDF